MRNVPLSTTEAATVETAAAESAKSNADTTLSLQDRLTTQQLATG